MPPKDIFVNTGNESASAAPVATPIAAPPPINVPKPKRSFPKPLLFGVIGVVVLIIIFALFMLFRRGVGVSSQITWWGLWEDAATVQPLITEYEAAHSGVKITYVRQSQQDYRERLTSSLAKGTGPDIFTIHNSWVPMFKSSLDSLPSTVMNPADYAKTFYRIASSDLISGNSIVAIPLEYDALTLYVNTEIFEKAGIQVPTTWDDVRKVAKALTIKNDQDQIVQSGIAMGRTENVDNWPEILALLMIQNNVNLANPVGSKAEGALIYFTNFALADGVWDETLPPSTQAFGAGKLAMYIGPSWRAFEIQKQSPNLKFKTYPIPQLPKDTPTQPDITYASYWAEGVWSGSPGKAVAWDFLKFISQKDSMQKLYQNEAKTRSFGQPYSRTDMASLLTDHPILGSIISKAGGARSWYLYSRTFDGPTGINTQLTNYFKDAVNAVTIGKKFPKDALATAALGVAQVLSQYRISSQ